MKTLLVALNAKYIHSNPAVYSLQKSAAAYEERLQLSVGEVNVREFTINQSLETIYYTILAENPDTVAFSVYIWNVEMIKSLCRDLKQAKPGLSIWLGGPEVSYGIEGKGFAEGSCDYVIEGEGERAFFALLVKQAGYAYPDSVPIEWGVTEFHQHIQAKPIENLDELPYLYEDLSPFQNRILYYEASRGCPFHCAYCLSAAENGVRELPLPRVLRELDELQQRGVKQIKLVDRTFNCHPSRAKAILEWILALPESCCTNFHFEVEADLLPETLVDLMVQMPKGRIQLEIGIQSTNPDTLRACGRTDRLERVFHNVKRLLERGNINIHVDLIAGLPEEGYVRFAESFNEVYHLGAHQFQLGFLKLLTGAPMNQLVKPYGYTFSAHPPYEILSNQLISPEELFQLKCIEDVLERLYNSGRFSRFLALLEKQYESPFAMMETIARYFWKNELTFSALGLAELSDTMAAFLTTQNIVKQQEQELLKALLLDYYAATPSDKLPHHLHELAQFPRVSGQNKSPQSGQKLAAAALLRQIGRRERKIVIRCLAGSLVAVDYTERDPVTDQYEIVKIMD